MTLNMTWHDIWHYIWHDMTWNGIGHNMIINDMTLHMTHDHTWHYMAYDMTYDKWYDIWHDITWSDMVYNLTWHITCCDVMACPPYCGEIWAPIPLGGRRYCHTWMWMGNFLVISCHISHVISSHMSRHIIYHVIFGMPS